MGLGLRVSCWAESTQGCETARPASFSRTSHLVSVRVRVNVRVRVRVRRPASFSRTSHLASISVRVSVRVRVCVRVWGWVWVRGWG